MAAAAFNPLSQSLVADAPAIADMTLAEALADTARRLGVAWDKSVLDGYPGEPGYSRRTRLLVIVGCVAVCWTPIIAVGYAILVR